VCDENVCDKNVSSVRDKCVCLCASSEYVFVHVISMCDV